MMGVMLSAAGSLAWYHDTLCANIDYDTLIGEAEQVPPGSDGLVFLPYLTGERTPYADPLATGAFVGLTPRHTRGHMTRAVLEGVAFGLRDNLLLLQEAGLAPSDELRICGWRCQESAVAADSGRYSAGRAKGRARNRGCGTRRSVAGRGRSGVLGIHGGGVRRSCRHTECHTTGPELPSICRSPRALCFVVRTIEAVLPRLAGESLPGCRCDA